MAQGTEVLTVSEILAPTGKTILCHFYNINSSISGYTHRLYITTYYGIDKTGEHEHVKVSKKGISEECKGYW